MRIVYVGPHQEVTLAPAAGGIRFVRGEPVDVDDELGRSLTRQSTFEQAKPSRRARGSAAAANPRVETRGGDGGESAEAGPDKPAKP